MQDGKSLQAATSHDLSDNFAKSFDVSFLDSDGATKHVYQTSWGMSTRTIGGLIMIHSDDKGLILPPRIAPVQVVIIPISRDADDGVMVAVSDIRDSLSQICTVKVDTRDNLRTGEKFYEWEKKGVPLRLELGPKDLANGSCVLVRRDTSEKLSCPIAELKERVVGLLEQIQKKLFDAAKAKRDSMDRRVDTWTEFEADIEAGGYLWAHWCGQPSCEAEIKEKVKAVSRCLPFASEQEAGEHTCIHCGKATKGRRWIFAKAY
jgi:prolyl-tRNA synthetase